MGSNNMDMHSDIQILKNDSKKRRCDKKDDGIPK